MYLRWVDTLLMVPQIKPSAIPFESKVAPISVLRRRISSLAKEAVTPLRSMMAKYDFQNSPKRESSSGFTISISVPQTMRKPNFSMRCSITLGRPIKIGFAIPSSSTICTARRTRSSSPSQKTMRFCASGTPLAIVKRGFIKVPE